MRLIGLMPAKNEGWILGLSARIALRWCDALIVFNHGSTDETEKIAVDVEREHPCRVSGMLEMDPAWNEASYRQRMLEVGRKWGGTHFALIDADEVLTANLLPRVRGLVESLHPAEGLRLPWLCLWRSIDRHRCDPSPFGRARCAFAFCDAPHLSHRAGDGDYQLHTRYPSGAIMHNAGEHADGGVMHFQHADWRRVCAKQVLYRMTERLRWTRSAAEIEATYAATTNEDGLAMAPTPAAWWAGYEPLLGHLRLGQPIWQEAQIAELLAQHGREKFAGLNLMGF